VLISNFTLKSNDDLVYDRSSKKAGFDMKGPVDPEVMFDWKADFWFWLTMGRDKEDV
jgi:hypothetical protein